MRRALGLVVSCVLITMCAAGLLAAFVYRHEITLHKDYIGAISSLATVFAFVVGSVALFLNWRAVETAIEVARKQKAYEVMSKFIEDPFFVACRQFVENELPGTQLLELLASDPKKHRHTLVTIHVAGLESHKESIGTVIDTVSHFFDRLGTLAAAGAIDVAMPAMMFGNTATRVWNILKPITEATDVVRTARMNAEESPLRSRGTQYQSGFAYFVRECPKVNPSWARLLRHRDLYQ